MNRAARREIKETVIGIALVAILVLVVAAVFRDGGFADGSYEVSAVFGRADGLSEGSEVHAAGIPVGKVVDLALVDGYRARAVLRIDRGVELDTDATAAVVTDGIFGDKFVRIDIGGGEATIPAGGEIVYTQDSMVIDDLLSLIISRARANRARNAVDGAQEDEAE